MSVKGYGLCGRHTETVETPTVNLLRFNHPVNLLRFNHPLVKMQIDKYDV